MARRAIATGWVNVRADLDDLRQDFDAARAETIKSTIQEFNPIHSEVQGISFGFKK